MMDECVHCNSGSTALAHKLLNDKDFIVVCDAHPLIEGHILIMPKSHVPCIGSLSKDLFSRFTQLYAQVSNFLLVEYGPIVAFEHGILGQTVFHAHTHLLPFVGGADDILTDPNALIPITNITELQNIYRDEDGYMFIEIRNRMYLLDKRYVRPRIFRDLFSTALGTEERSDWVLSEGNEELMESFRNDIAKLKLKWVSRFSYNQGSDISH